LTAPECLLLRELGIEADRICPADAPFPLWLVHLPRPPSPSLIGLLSPEEWERARRFRASFLRDRYVAAHAGLRLLIQHQFGQPAARQRFVRNAFGRPRLVERGDVRSSISYSGKYALIGLSGERDVGVDLEAERPIDDALALAEVHCTPRERAALRRALKMGKAYNNGFLRAWVRKEACVKALERGLSIPLETLDCGIGSKTTTVKFGESKISTGVVHACDRFIISSPCDLIIGWAQLNH
jgi:4'-phosphopantetheinyl transferase